MKRYSFLLASALVVIGALAGAAQAQTPPPKPAAKPAAAKPAPAKPAATPAASEAALGGGSGKTSGPLLSRDELYSDLRELIRDLKRNPWKFFWKE